MKKLIIASCCSLLAYTNIYGLDPVQEKYDVKIEQELKRHKMEMERIRTLMITNYNSLLKRAMKEGRLELANQVNAQVAWLKSGGDPLKMAPLKNMATDSDNSERRPENVPEDAKRFKNSYYKVFDGKISWSSAQKKCKDLNGHLVYIDSEGEHGFLKKLLKSKCVWVGAKYTTREFKWGNGSKMSNILHSQVMVHYKKDHKKKYASFSRFGDLNARPSSGLEKSFPIKNIQGYLCEWEVN